MIQAEWQLLYSIKKRDRFDEESQCGKYTSKGLDFPVDEINVYGMALDLDGRRLYYTDDYTDSIYRVSIDENNPVPEQVLNIYDGSWGVSLRDIVLFNK